MTAPTRAAADATDAPAIGTTPPMAPAIGTAPPMPPAIGGTLPTPLAIVARATGAVIEREIAKLFRQRGRLVASLVRPLLWLLVIGAGFAASRRAQGGGEYQQFLVPGVLGMTLLFGGMLAALSTVNDKESGVMRMLVIAPFAHGWIVIAKTASAILAALVQAIILLAMLAVLGFLREPLSWIWLAAGMFGTALACASLGMLVAAWSKTLDNYATLMNLVIFPVFFLSGSLYPVEQLPIPLKLIATLNPYTHGVDLLRHAAMSGTGTAAFAAGTDIAVILVFSAAALAIAAARFSRGGANETLVHGRARS